MVLAWDWAQDPGRGWEGRWVAGAELTGRRCVSGGHQELGTWGLGARRATFHPGCAEHTLETQHEEASGRAAYRGSDVVISQQS